MNNPLLLTTPQLDVLKELINIGVGKSSKSLNELIHKNITLQVPFVQIMNYKELIEYLRKTKNEQYASVTLPFKGELLGNIKLVLSSSSAIKLADSFIGEDVDDSDLDSIRSGVLNEVGNIVTNAVLGSMCNMLGINLTYIVPYFEEGEKEMIVPEDLSTSDSVILFSQTEFIVDELEISGSFAMFFEMESFKILIEKIDKLLSN